MMLENGINESLENRSLSEIYWILLSFVAANPERQRSLLPLPVPERDSPSSLQLNENPLLMLNLALWEYFNYWWDEFFPRIVAVEKFDAALKGLGVMTDADPGIFCLEELLQGEAWVRLRSLATSALDEAGLPEYEFSGVVPLNELVEATAAEEDLGKV